MLYKDITKIDNSYAKLRFKINFIYIRLEQHIDIIQKYYARKNALNTYN